jgi:hypothetical protein
MSSSAIETAPGLTKTSAIPNSKNELRFCTEITAVWSNFAKSASDFYRTKDLISIIFVLSQIIFLEVVHLRNRIAIACIAIVIIILTIALINPIEAPVGYIIATAVIGIVIIIALIQSIMINRLPELTTKAKITAKNVVEEKTTGPNPSLDSKKTFYKLTFETEDNFQ